MPPRSQAIQPVNLGLYYDRSLLNIPARGLSDGRNFRIRRGITSNVDLGWVPFNRLLGTNNSAMKSLLHFDGTDTSTTILDSGVGQAGPPYRAWTAAGNAQIDTAQSVFGGSSLLLDGTGDWVLTPMVAGLQAGASDWELELRFRRTSALGTDENLVGIVSDPGFAGTEATTGLILTVTSASKLQIIVSNGTNFFTITGTTSITIDTWTHVRVNRVGSTLTLFKDGLSEGSTTITGSVNSITGNLVVGAVVSGDANSFTGNIDEFAYSIGGTYSSADFALPNGPYQKVLSGPVMLIDSLLSRNAPETMVVATTRDLYAYDPTDTKFYWITPQYNTATVDVSAANPAVVTANTGAPTWVTVGIKAGDLIKFGATASPEPDDNWYEIATVDGESQLTLTTAVTGAALTNVSYVISRRFTGTTRDIWDTDTFVQPDDGTGNDMMFFTNGVDSVATWTIQTDYALLHPELGFTAKQLRIFKNMMLYGNLDIAGTLYPTTFINSDVAKPLDVVNGLAAQFKVHDGVDQIHEMEDLGDNMVFYSERHVTLAQFVGDPLLFVFRQAGSGVGPIGPRLVADFGDYHEFIGADTEYRFDGVTLKEIGSHVWRAVLRNRDASRQLLGFNHFDEESGDLIWAMPLTDDDGLGNTEAGPEEAFAEHYLEFDDPRIPTPFSRRNFPFLCGGYWFTSEVLAFDTVDETWEAMSAKWDSSFLSAAFPLNLMGDANGQIYILGISQYQDGVAAPSYIHFGRRPLGDTKMRGLLRRVYPYVTQSTGNLLVKTFYSDHASGPVTTSQEDTMDLLLPQEGHFVTPYRRGRFFEIEFSRDDGEPYEIEGYDIDIIPGGYR